MGTPVNKSDHSKTVEEYLEKLKDGCVLLSHENLQDPNFKLTIVLVCIHNKEGTFGLVCNRPSHMPLSEVFDIDDIYKKEKRCIYIGGPVQQSNLIVIQLKDNAAKNSYKITNRVYLGGEWGAINDILSEDPFITRLFLGYSGWAPGQLEMEITEGAWEVYQVNVENFLLNWEEPLYNDHNKIRDYLIKHS